MRLSGTVYSNILEMDTPISIVTPNNLTKEQPYKVAYILHGLRGNASSWLDYSMLPVYAMGGNTIYILPDAGRSFYSDMKHGFRYFTFITEELPRICRSVFNISADRENTAVMGASMGGYGALKCALTKPEQYGLCGAFSSGCLFIKNDLALMREHGLEAAAQIWGPQLANDIPSAFGDDLAWKPEYELTELAKSAKQKGILPNIYMTCGTEDKFYPDHVSFCKELDGIGVDYIFEQWQARHDFLCFDEALKRTVFKFGL